MWIIEDNSSEFKKNMAQRFNVLCNAANFSYPKYDNTRII